MHQVSNPLLPEQLPFVRFMDHMEQQGFDDIDRDVVMAPFSYREINTMNGSQFSSPEKWSQAITTALEKEQQDYAQLTSMGYPDTTGMSPRDGHMARIAYLMTKYPQADWDLLLSGQEEAMSRKGSLAPRASPPVTVQEIHKQKIRYLARQDQRDELIANGDKDGMLVGVTRSWLRVRGFLERHGVDCEELKRTRGSLEYYGLPLADDAFRSTDVDTANTVDPVQSDNTAGGDDDAPAAAEPQPATPPDTMTAREVSQRVNLTYQTVIRALASGDLPYGKKVGRNWICARQPFLDWLASNDDTVRSMSSQAGERPGRKPTPEPQRPPSSTRGRMPSF